MDPSPAPSAPRTAVPAPARDWGRLVPRLVAGALAVMALLHVVRQGGDFHTYWRAAHRFLDGAPLYPASDGLGTYRYAPGVLAFLAPFAALPLPAARAIWFALAVAAGWWVARRLVRDLSAPERAIPSPAPGTAATAAGLAGLAVGAGFLGVSRPWLDEFFYGQADWLVLALLVAAFAAEDRDRDGQAGFLVALAGGLKLAPFLLALDFALRRRWRALGGTAAGVALLAVAPVPFYGTAGTVAVHADWIRSLSGSATAVVGSHLNQGVFGLVAHLAQPARDTPLPAGAPTWAALALAAAVVLAALTAPSPHPRRGLLVLAMALASPLGWTWNFVLAWPALAHLAATGRRARLAVAGFGLALLLCIYDVVGPRVEDRVFLLTLPGLGYLAFFAWIRAAGRWPGSTSRPRGRSPPAARA